MAFNIFNSSNNNKIKLSEQEIERTRLIQETLGYVAITLVGAYILSGCGLIENTKNDLVGVKDSIKPAIEKKMPHLGYTNMLKYLTSNQDRLQGFDPQQYGDLGGFKFKDNFNIYTVSVDDSKVKASICLVRKSDSKEFYITTILPIEIKVITDTLNTPVFGKELAIKLVGETLEKTDLTQSIFTFSDKLEF